MENGDLIQSDDLSISTDEKNSLVERHNKESSNFIQRLANTAYCHTRAICPVSSNKGRSVFTDATKSEFAYIEKDADSFTIDKIDIIYKIKNNRRYPQGYTWKKEVIKTDNAERAHWSVVYNHSPSPSSNINETDVLAKKFRCGNCDIMARVAFVYLRNKQVVDVEIIGALFGHTFVVVNRERTSDLNDLSTWGKDCWVCDPWAEIVCKAEDYVSHWTEKMNSWQQSSRVIYDNNVGGWIEAARWRNLMFYRNKHRMDFYHTFRNEDDDYLTSVADDQDDIAADSYRQYVSSKDDDELTDMYNADSEHCCLLL